MSETSKFTEDILAAVKEKSDSLIAEAENESQKSFDSAKGQINREAEDIVRNARNEADSLKRRHMSEARHRVKLHEQQEKNMILNEVLEITRKRVAEVAKDETKYIPYLAAFIEAAITELGFESATVHLNATDLRRVDRAKLEREISKRLQKPVKMVWSNEPVESLGGAIVSNEDGRIRIVNTLDVRFEALESKLLIEAGKLLFSE